ncbi:MAG: cupin domain-containing protein [Campylobacterales bacterium]|nr:cupin domain-containing protein [Campylobacterales bacterium]
MKKVSFTDKLSFGDKPKITLMLETPSSKEIRICMAKGTIMKEHTAPQAITIMLIKGRLLIVSEGEECILEDGEMVYFDARVPHSLEAIDECIIRLVLSKQDTVQRVQKIIGMA